MSKLALATGGAKGIGLAISRDLARSGYRVAVVGRDVGAIDATVGTISESDGDAVAMPMDVSSPAEVDQVFARAAPEHGPIVVLVNCAGVIVREHADQYANDDCLRVIQADLNGAFWCARSAARHMLPAGGGSIINIGSVASVVGTAGRASYSAAKAGLSGLTRTLALEWAGRGIRVNTVASGWTATEMVQRASRLAGSTSRPDSAAFP
jgi:NAD(P)-dependent dehydrogenase (short-subunit alcohol dehydrogenase family)